MVHFSIIVLGVFIGYGFCVEEDNLRNALNSITSRQRQLANAAATNYYVIPNKEFDKELPYDDELMYLDSPPRDYADTNRETIGYGYQKSPTPNYRIYEDDRAPYSEPEDYQKEIKERLLERLMLDILEEDEEPSSPVAASAAAALPPQKSLQKKSFFREREFSEVPENLQNFYPNAGDEETIFLAPPSSFRERTAKTKPQSHRRLVRPYSFEDTPDSEDSEDYGTGFNSLFDKYKDGGAGAGAQDTDSDAPLTNEDVENFLNYLNDKTSQSGYYDYPSPNAYATKSKKRDAAKRKKYWLSGQQQRNERYSIQKRSAVDEKSTSSSSSSSSSARPVIATTSTEKNNETRRPTSTSTTMKPTVTTTEVQANKTKAPKKVEPAKLEKPKPMVSKFQSGQKEIPVDIRSREPLNIRKKSIDWSDYFGVDKRQKKSSNFKDQRKDDVLLDQYIQSYILQSVRNSAFNNRAPEHRYYPKRERLREPYPYNRFDTDEDLQKAEDLIIDDVLKYTGAHDGVTDPKELERFKENVINELAAAYNLEKLRKEIFEDTNNKKKKKSMGEPLPHHHSNDKRVAVKKESAEVLPLDLDDLKIKHNATFFNKEYPNKKPNQHEHTKRRYSKSSGASTECPVISKLIERCQLASRSVKDFEGTFIPSCILHQICYICGTKDRNTDTCDINFISDMGSVCGNEPLCRYSAQRVLTALSDVKNPIYKCDSCMADILQYIYEK